MTRKQAYAIVCNTELCPENYLQMEEMLRYKAADARANLINLLCTQSDSDLYGSVQRLINDKKEEKRTAALDIIMQTGKDEKLTDLFDKCRELVSNI